mmetsp:Transcript_11309/g.16556  ORF Transcript_11309/g.16556 Transcript_11309/m.16556 type:complete len:208 (+) Transcript_11309:462-1085(+)
MREANRINRNCHTTLFLLCGHVKPTDSFQAGEAAQHIDNCLRLKRSIFFFKFFQGGIDPGIELGHESVLFRIQCKVTNTRMWKVSSEDATRARTNDNQGIILADHFERRARFTIDDLAFVVPDASDLILLHSKESLTTFSHTHYHAAGCMRTSHRFVVVDALDLPAGNRSHIRSFAFLTWNPAYNLPCNIMVKGLVFRPSNENTKVV